MSEQPAGLTHIAASGEAHMVDVGDKAETVRVAVAEGHIRMRPETLTIIRDGNAKKGDVIDTAPVWQGVVETVPLVVQQDVAVTMSRDARKNMQVTARYDAPLEAPIQKGQEVGTVEISAPNMPTKSYPLYAGEDVPELGLFGKAMSALSKQAGATTALAAAHPLKSIRLLAAVLVQALCSRRRPSWTSPRALNSPPLSSIPFSP